MYIWAGGLHTRVSTHPQPVVIYSPDPTGKVIGGGQQIGTLEDSETAHIII